MISLYLFTVRHDYALVTKTDNKMKQLLEKEILPTNTGKHDIVNFASCITFQKKKHRKEQKKDQNMWHQVYCKTL